MIRSDPAVFDRGWTNLYPQKLALRVEVGIHYHHTMIMMIIMMMIIRGIG